MKLKVFYHVTDLPYWEEITKDQMDRIFSSGLIDNAEVHLNLHYNPDSFTEFLKNYQHPNLVLHYSKNTREDGEHSTVVLMTDTAKADDEVWGALYLHQKGITHAPGGYWKSPEQTKHWRRYLDYFNIVRWKDCADKLEEGYDCAGVELQMSGIDGLEVYVGNVYWTRSDYIRRNTPHLVLPTTVGLQPQLDPVASTKYRDDCEFWICRAKPKTYSFHHSGLNLYTQNVLEETYIK